MTLWPKCKSKDEESLARELVRYTIIVDGIFAVLEEIRDFLRRLLTMQAQQTFTIVIAPEPLAITTPAALPAATRGVAVSDQLAATGGTPPFAWSVDPSTPLPAGLALDSGSGLLSGTPTVNGTFSFNVIVKDAQG